MPESDAVILCGGAGLRLRSVIGDAPKSMATVAGRPFLELLLYQLHQSAFRRVILAAGYRMDSIRSCFGDQAFGLDLIYSSEEIPLGTGGALRNATRFITSRSALVLNGDSHTPVDLAAFERSHRESLADVSLVAVPGDGRADCGGLVLDGDGKVVRFEEKGSAAPAHFISAGIYTISGAILTDIPSERPISLEYELFPGWLSAGKNVRALVYPGHCVDIGTPSRYENAQGILSEFASSITNSIQEGQYR